MKVSSNSSPVNYYLIQEVIAATGGSDLSNEFHVFKSEEVVEMEKSAIPFRLDHFLALLVIEGEIKAQLNLLEYTLSKNSLLIISPNVLHQFREISTDHSFIGIGFSHKFLAAAGIHKAYVDSFDFFYAHSRPHLNLSAKEAEQLIQPLLLLRDKEKAREDILFQEEIFKHAFSLFLFEVASLFKKSRDLNSEKLTRKQELVMQFLKHLGKHFREERRVQYYADLLYISPKHLTSTISAVTGKSCGSLISEMVILEAKLLLADLSASISDVSDKLNFPDQFAFSKFFKKHTGMTPSDYKASLAV